MLSLSHRPVDFERKYSLNEDLAAEKTCWEDHEVDRVAILEPYFDPKAFYQVHKPLAKEAYQLKEEELKEYAEQATDIRARLSEKAVELNMQLAARTEDDDHSGQKKIMQLNRRYTRKRRGLKNTEEIDQGKLDWPRPKYRKRRQHELSIEDKVAIVHSVLVEKNSNITTAQKFRVTPALVSLLLCKVKKAPKYFEELREKQAGREKKSRLVRTVALEHIAAGKPIEKAAVVRE